MGRFETEFLTQEDNLKGLARINTQWVERAMAHTLHRRVILDMDSSGLYRLESLAVGGSRVTGFDPDVNDYQISVATWRRFRLPGRAEAHFEAP